ncbi:hypothetical protein NM688_g896 [Phlebia brevispora]|uniref:Uncharacterized protein n=1 Tax=Phlebia brevispora TaxID=194682 RepID=A0ACC1TCU9_9APHY|nr:hypothetical protein NM688_g896 [Phlebia brevispora]
MVRNGGVKLCAHCILADLFQTLDVTPHGPYYALYRPRTNTYAGDKDVVVRLPMQACGSGAACPYSRLGAFGAVIGSVPWEASAGEGPREYEDLDKNKNKSNFFGLTLSRL